MYVCGSNALLFGGKAAGPRLNIIEEGRYKLCVGEDSIKKLKKYYKKINC